MSAQDNARVAREFVEKFNTRDWDGIAALTAANAEAQDIPTGLTFHGPEGAKQFNLTWATAFPDGKVTVSNVIADDQGATVEFTGKGTHTGPLASPTGDIAPTGKPINVRYSAVLELRDGKVTSTRLYYDVATILRQLGMMPG